MNPDSLLREYYAITEEGLDSEDIEMMMDDFKFDEEVDEPEQIKKLKLAKKKKLLKLKSSLDNSRSCTSSLLSQGKVLALLQKSSKLIGNI